MPPLALAVLGALLMAALSTLYDFVWAHFALRHHVVYGLIHGTTLLAALGLVLGIAPGRPAAGLAGGALAGLMAAASFYVFVGPLGFLGALVAAWMVLWLLFAGLGAWLDRRSPVSAPALARGLAAAVLSGAAFWLVSDMWTAHQTPPHYAWNFARWTFAFLPGCVALLAGRR